MTGSFGPRFETWLRRLRRRTRSATYLRKWVVLGAVIGVVGGIGAIVFYTALEWTTHFFLGVLAGYTPPSPAGEGGAPITDAARPWALPLVVALGGLISGILVFRFAPEAEGHGTDAAIAAYHHHPRGIRARIPVVKLVASAVTIGSGGSGGREGPTAQISAGFGSYLGRLLDLDARDARIAVAVGMAAGIGAIFRAPLGGAVLGAELLYRDDVESEVLVPSFIATIIAYSIFGSVEGFSPIFGIQAGFGFNNPAQLGWYALIGLACGAVGLLYINNFYGLMDRFAALADPALAEAGDRGLPRRLHGARHPGRPRHGIRLPPGRARPANAARDPALDGPHPAIREDPRDVTFDRFRRLGWHLRAGDVHRRHARRRDLAPPRADRAGHPDRPGAIRDRRDDGPVRQRRPRPAGGDADGRRDDRQPLDARSGHGRGRACHLRRRHEDDLPEPARHAGRFPGTAVPLRASAARGGPGRRRSPAGARWSWAPTKPWRPLGPGSRQPGSRGLRSSTTMEWSWAWSTSTSFVASVDDQLVGAAAFVREPILAADDGLDDALGALADHRRSWAPVVSGGRLVGVLSVRDAMAAYRVALSGNVRQVRGLRAGGVIIEAEIPAGLRTSPGGWSPRCHGLVMPSWWRSSATMDSWSLGETFG